jgi:transcriptional regulator of acetoin/glycerol metabolism
VQAGEFREDLYYRLNGITLQLPTLRERTDKRELITALLADDDNDEPIPSIHEHAMQKLLDYPWPGNIRQLRNTLRTAAALCTDGMIHVGNLPHEITEAGASTGSIILSKESAAPLQSAERDALLRELERLHWNISRAANALGVSRNTLYRKMRKHDIDLPG